MATAAGIPIRASKGYIAVYDPASNGYFMLDNSLYEFQTETMLDGFTVSGGWSRKIHRENLASVTVVLPEDEPSSIEASAFIQNNSYDLFCRRGNVGDNEFDVFRNTVFRGLRKVNPTGRGMHRMVQVLFEGGVYVPQQDIESIDGGALQTYLTGISRS